MSNTKALSFLRRSESLLEITNQLSLPRRVEDTELVRFAAQEYFVAFCKAVKPDYQLTKFHQLLADHLQEAYERVRSNRDVRLMVEMPPRFGKTELVSRLFPAWVLGKEGWPIICASYGSTLAERNSEDCRDIVNSDMYKYIFPGTRLHPDSTSKEFWKTVKGGSYRAAGVGSSLTGMGGKFLICDDPFKDRADADSEVIREGTWKWWQSVFMTRREGRTGVIVLNTRWHLDDLSGRLLEQDAEEGGGKWERFRFPAVAEEDEYIDGKLFRKAGESLWPEKFPLVDLLETKKNTDVYEWSSLYQQSPILSENQEFRSEWFKYFEEKDIENKYLDIYVAVDLAISQKKSADNTSIQVVGKERDKPEWYHLEEDTGRFDPGQVVDKLFALKKKYGARLRKVGIEVVAYQKSMIYSLNEEMKRQELYFDIEELRSSSAKEERIRGLIQLYKTGVLYHRKGVDNDLEAELLQFPKGRRDDRIDALAMLLQVVSLTRYGNQTAKRYVPKSTTYLPKTVKN